MSQNVGAKMCKKKLHKIWWKTTQIVHNFTCTFSNNFQHAKGHKKQVLVTQDKCERNHKVFTSFLSTFSTKIKEKTINQSKNNSPVFLDQSWHVICQDWLKSTKKIIWIFLGIFKGRFESAGVQLAKKSVQHAGKGGAHSKLERKSNNSLGFGQARRVVGMELERVWADPWVLGSYKRLAVLFFPHFSHKLLSKNAALLLSLENNSSPELWGRRPEKIPVRWPTAAPPHRSPKTSPNLKIFTYFESSHLSLSKSEFTNSIQANNSRISKRTGMETKNQGITSSSRIQFALLCSIRMLLLPCSRTPLRFPLLWFGSVLGHRGFEFPFFLLDLILLLLPLVSQFLFRFLCNFWLVIAWLWAIGSRLVGLWM